MAQIQLGAQQIRELQVIRELKPETLHSIASQLSALDPKPMRPAELLPAVIEVLAQDESSAESIVRQCVSLHVLMRNAGIAIDEVVRAIRAGIERDAKWTLTEIEKWNSVEPAFKELLGTDCFRFVAKALDLAYSYANLYRKCRILTDIRPLFSESADKVEAAVVSYTLRLQYDSVDGDHALSVAMDASDVHQLLEQCNRALKKAETARDLMQYKAEIRTALAGEPKND
ncbi:MAG: hypothetical protein WEB58_16930 [Planctomycetaceae bacterium]